LTRLISIMLITCTGAQVPVPGYKSRTRECVYP